MGLIVTVESTTIISVWPSGIALANCPAADAAVSRWLVIDDDRLMHRRREPIGDRARDQVQGAPRGGRDHERDRLPRIAILRPYGNCRSNPMPSTDRTTAYLRLVFMDTTLCSDRASALKSAPK